MRRARPSPDREQALRRGSSKDVAGRSVRGVLWTVAGQWGAQVLRVGSIVVLARFLSPDDYGLVAMVTAVTGLIAVAGGLSESVVQKADLSHEQASALFWISSALGLLLTVLVAAAAPLIAAFYGRPELVGITVATSVVFLISGLTVQHQGLMLRQMQFKSIAARALAGTGLGLVVSVVLAVAGLGYWSLVAGQIVSALTTAVMTWVAVSWRPSRPRRAVGLREMLSFGGGISAFRLLDYASKNADNIIIGRLLGAGPLGLYTRGYGLFMLPLQQIHGPVASVARPAMAGLWSEPERYRRYYLAALSGLCYFVMPLVAVLAVLAVPVVAVMLGPQWAESADVFRWLAVAGFLQVVGNTNGWLYTSSGRSWAMARWGLISRPLLIAAFFVGVPWGIVGVAISYAAAQLVLTPLGIAHAGRGTPVSLADVLRSVVRPAIVAGVAGLTAAGVLLLLAAEPPWVQLLGGGGLAAAVSAIVLLGWGTCRREVFRLVAIVRSGRAAKGRPAGTPAGEQAVPATTALVPPQTKSAVEP